MKKWIAMILVLVLLIGLLPACSLTQTRSIRCLVAGSASDPWSVASFYSMLQQVNESMEGKWGITCNAMGIEEDCYKPTVKALAQEADQLLLLSGEQIYRAGREVIAASDRLFAVMDADNAQTADHVDVLEWDQEQIGFISAVAAVTQGEKVGYLMGRTDLRGLRRLYGFMQGLAYCGVQDFALMTCYENDSYNKTLAYGQQMLDAGVGVICTDTEKSALGALDAAREGDAVVLDMGCGLKEKVTAKARLASIAVSVDLDQAGALEKYLSGGRFGGNRHIYGVQDNLICVNANDSCNSAVGDLSKVQDAIGQLSDGTLVLKRYTDNKDDYHALREAMAKSAEASERELLKYSVEYTFHQAIPNSSGTPDWKYTPRMGSALKPDGWTAGGVWGTVYIQEDAEYVENVGIELSNMKLWGYSPTQGWKLLTHDIPKGGFYDENFTNDDSVQFPEKMRINPEKRANTILLDAETIGRNYHPFSSQLDFVALGMEDLQYVISTLDARLVMWDENGPDNREQAKYCFDVGGDWWVYVGATWNAQWTANKDMAVGQYRPIGTEVTRAYMTTVPSELFDELVTEELLAQVLAAEGGQS